MPLPTATPMHLEILIPILLIVSGLAGGIFLERFVVDWVRLAARRTSWRGDNIVVQSLRGIPVFWGVALGLYLATVVLDTYENAEPVIQMLQKGLLVALLGSLTVVAARMASGFVTTYAGREGSFLPPTSLIPTIIRLLVYAMGVLVILNTLQVSIAPLLTTLGVGGLAVALALQETLSNVFAGLYLIAARQVRSGDYVELESGSAGYIEDINWRSTSIRTIHGNHIIVPNSNLASTTVTNFHRPNREMLIRVAVGVAYDSDLDRVEQITKEVGREVLEDLTGQTNPFEPRVYFQAFGEFSINFIVFLKAREFYDQFEVRHRFIKRLVRRYEDEGIRIPFPIKEFEMELSTGGFEHGQLSPSQGASSPFDSDAPAPKNEETE